MSHYTFMAPPLRNVEEFLNKHSIPYQTGKNNTIIIPKYGFMGNDVEIVIRYESARMLLTFKIEGKPYPIAIRKILYEFLNIVNSKKVLGKYYLSPKEGRLIFKFERLLSEREIIDSAIDAGLVITAVGFLQINEDIETGFAKEISAAKNSKKASKP